MSPAEETLASELRADPKLKETPIVFLTARAGPIVAIGSQFIADQIRVAQRAKEASPDDPRVSDTLGWILYKRGVYQRAHALFKESATKLPGEPAIQYRLGLAAMKVGDRDGADLPCRSEQTGEPARGRHDLTGRPRFVTAVRERLKS